jgi:pimeloyl-ACP methyl ester carboxylesterase
MDAIREALGEASINYFGYAYGTYLGAVYAELFPQRTDRFVLDSVVHPRRIWRRTFHAWGPAAEVAIPPFLRYAADNDATYGLGATPKEVRAKFFELLAEVEQEPFEIPGFGPVDHRQFREFVRAALRNDDSFPELALIWQLADQRELGAAPASQRLREEVLPAPPAAPRAAAADFPVPPPDNPFASPWAVVCGDADWPESPATYQRDVLRADRLFPFVGPMAANIWPLRLLAVRAARPGCGHRPPRRRQRTAGPEHPRSRPSTAPSRCGSGSAPAHAWSASATAATRSPSTAATPAPTRPPPPSSPPASSRPGTSTAPPSPPRAPPARPAPRSPGAPAPYRQSRKKPGLHCRPGHTRRYRLGD